MNKSKSQNGEDSSIPRALIHKKILDTAKEHPTASIRELATKVDGASKHLVERVIEQYGDPVHDEEEGDSDSNGESIIEDEQNSEKSVLGHEQRNEQTPNEKESNMVAHAETEIDNISEQQEKPQEAANTQKESAKTEADGETVASPVENSSNGKREPSSNSSAPDPDQLTEKQIRVLLAIRDRPHATQAELSELFDISRATISQRVNAIEGFEWRNRQEIVDAVFTENESMADSEDTHESVEELRSHIDQLRKRIESLEGAVEEVNESTQTPFANPELATKIVRACVESNQVTEEDEEEIIKELIGSGCP
ncbi:MULTISPECIES: MarR family transcriptional regulator [Salinibaculum]|uniref:MarR family transcriptional regulator n=1 Tax=Salinibaculum TaxID=2732368 RepID=UPI0030D2EFCD